MDKILFKTLGFFFMSLSLWGCQSEEEDTNIVLKERKDIVLSRSEEEILDKSFDFAFQLFKQVNDAEAEKPNWMISPLSASYALGMMANGADGNTLAEIKEVLGYENASMDELNAYYKMLTETLVDLDNSTQIGIVNSLWLKNGFSVKDAYVDAVESSYDADVDYLKPSGKESADAINGWCAEKTGNLIPKIWDKPVPNDVKMLFLNALSFKGIWKKTFEKSDTQEDEFMNLDGTVSKIPMMNLSNKTFRNVVDEKWGVLELPYGNEAFSMVVFLPVEGVSIDDVLCQLTGTEWKKWNERLYEWYPKIVKIQFPRFEMSYHKDMVEVLKGMGIKDAFDAERADFSLLASDATLVNLFEQHTYLKVDEKGTEASAVTQGGLVDYYAPGPKFIVNKPFLYFIKEKSTNAILFMGKVTKL